MKKFEMPSYGDERKEILDMAYAKAQGIALSNEIRLNDFIDLYTEAGVLADQDLIKRLESRFEKSNFNEEIERDQLAIILETIIFEQAEQSNWLGDKVSTIKTSRYDDIVNGVDMIAEFREDSYRTTHSAFAIDATFSSAAGDKFKKIKEKIDSGALAKIKYFQSEQSPYRGELSRIPITVASAHAKTIDELAQMWIEKDKKGLAKHWIQYQILEELIEQSKIFASYAQKQDQSQAKNSYSQIIDIAEGIWNSKTKINPDSGQRDDNFYSTLSNIKLVFGNN